MKKPLYSVVSTGLFIFGLVGQADAALVGRLPATPGGTDYQAYYDTQADLTWLADANYAKTSGWAADHAYGYGFGIWVVSPSGLMSWAPAQAWVSSLNIGGVTGWRLPTTIDVGSDGTTYSNLYQGVDTGYNITTHSELSNLFYNVLGNAAAYDTNGNQRTCATLPGKCLTNHGPFTNIQPAGYWADAAIFVNNVAAWAFEMGAGSQSVENKYNSFYVWPVHSGDVAPVPLPAATGLFTAGMLVLSGVARRKKTA